MVLILDYASDLVSIQVSYSDIGEILIVYSSIEWLN